MTNGGKSLKKKVLAFFILLVFAIIVVIGVEQNPFNQQAQSVQKREAEDYFEIYEARIRDYEYLPAGASYENSTTLKIYSLSFRLKAKLGDAHDVNIVGWGQAEPVYIETILKDQNQVVDIDSPRPYAYVSQKTDGKFPVRVLITSAEADGSIIIYL